MRCEATYRHLSARKGYALSRHASLEEQERLVLDVAMAARGPRGGLPRDSLRSHKNTKTLYAQVVLGAAGAWRAEVAPQGAVGAARILLCSTELEPEAISTVHPGGSMPLACPSPLSPLFFFFFIRCLVVKESALLTASLRP